MGLYDYSLEPEFKLAAPRRVSFTKSALLLRAFLIVALLVSIILTPIYALKDIHHLGYLISNCRPVQGEITGRTTKIEKLYTAYYLTFSYAVHGRSFDGVERVPEEDYEMNSKGSPITLAYLPQNPTVHFIGTITGDTMRVGITNWIGRALVIVGFFAVFALGNELGLRNQWNLLRCGKTARASVISMWARRGNWGPSASSISYRMTCHFWTGQEEISKQFIVTGSIYEQVHVGDHVTIVFDKRNPQNCLPYKAFSDVFLKIKSC